MKEIKFNPHTNMLEEDRYTYSLQDVAHFVAAELSTLDGVLSTATHFMLKTYKAQGVFAEGFNEDDRLSVSP